MIGNRRRALWVGALLAILVATAFAWSLTGGASAISIRDIVLTLTGQGTPLDHYVIVDLRMPRAVVAVFAGAALGTSGAIFQALVRNPLASPDIIGITAGASAGAVVGIVYLGASGAVVSMLALISGLVTAVVIYLVSWRRVGSGYRMVLVGIGIGAFLSAGAGLLLVRASRNELQRATVWLTGSLTGREWQHVPAVTVATLILVPVTLAMATRLHMLLLGDDTARALGLRVHLTRGALVLVGVGLASFAVAAAGPITFVAFVSPAIARRLVGSPLTLLPSALFGALLVLLADFVGRTSTLGVPMPVGAVTGIIGGAYFIYLLARASRNGIM